MSTEGMRAVERAMYPTGRIVDERPLYRVELKLIPLVHEGNRLRKLVPDPDGIVVLLRGDAQVDIEASLGSREHRLRWIGTDGGVTLQGEVVD